MVKLLALLAHPAKPVLGKQMVAGPVSFLVQALLLLGKQMVALPVSFLVRLVSNLVSILPII